MNNKTYLNKDDIPTVELGGSIMIRDIWVDETMVGVAFAAAKEGSKTGDDHTKECFGKSPQDIGVFLNIVSTSAESIEILIGKLRKAQQNLGSKIPPALVLTQKDREG